MRTRVAMFRGENEAVQLDLIFQLTGYPQGETLARYEALDQWHNFNASKAYQNSFAARFSTGKNRVLDKVGLDLLQRLLDIDPVTRISCEEALRHEYFHSADVDPRRCVLIL